MSSPERRRVAATLARQPADRIPLGELFVEDGLVAALAGRHRERPVPFATRRAVLERLHLDAIAAYPELPGGGPMLGVHLAAGEASGHPSPAGSATVPSRLGLPDPAELDWRPLRAWRSDSPFFTLAVLPGPFGELAYSQGVERFLALAWRRPEEARQLAEAMVDYALELAGRAREQGAEGFLIGEDVAWERGLLLRAATYRALFLPALRREVEGLRAHGAPVLFHSDGDLTGLLADLEGLGLDGLHGLSFDARPGLRLLTERLDGRLARWGGLDLAVLAGPPAGVLSSHIGEALAAGGGSPGFVFGSSAGVLDATLDPARVQEAFDEAYALACAVPARR